MAIGKIGGVRSSGYIRPIVRRLATDPAQRDVFVLRGMVVFVDAGQRRFALRQEGHAYNVGWSAQTEFVGTDAASMQGLEICAKGKIQSDDFQAESIVAV
jgi:hypothetical protein